MNENEFIFKKKDEEYQDYWFKVIGDTRDFLTEKYQEQSMDMISEVVYSMVDKTLGVKMVFPFNERVVCVDDNELQEIIIKKIKSIEGETNV